MPPCRPASSVEGSIALALFWSPGLFVHDVGPRSWSALPAAVIGALLGDRIAPRVHAGPFRTAVLDLLALSGALALGDALLRLSRRATCSASEVSPSGSCRERRRSNATGQVENFAITTLAGPCTNTVCPLMPLHMKIGAFGSSTQNWFR